jgi:ketosteroid isomerase-like protein
MKTSILAVLVFSTVIALPCHGQSADAAFLVDRYLTLDRARQAQGATAADVDRVLALLTDSVVYEHPRAGARLQGKATLRDGMLRFIGSMRSARDSIIERTSAPGVEVIVTETHAEALRDGNWTPFSRRALRVFEIDGQSIRRILEYGW